MKKMEEEKKEAAGQEAPAEKKPESGKARRARKAKPLNRRFIAILIILTIFAIIWSEYKHDKSGFYAALNSAGIKVQDPDPDMTLKEAEDLINTNLNSTVTVTSVTKQSGLFKIALQYSGNEYTAYLTKDKTLFFPDVVDFAKLQAEKAAEETPTKSDKPVVELFVMSHCPYGTMMEKGIIPVVQALGDKIDFKLKFCDYTMHGEKEVAEQMNQYCISQNQPDKLMSYLQCFLADEASSAKCQTQVGIDTASLTACVKSTDAQYKITETFKSAGEGTPAFPIYADDNQKYGVSGSPTLVVNGKTAKSERDPASLLKTICASFNNAPAECSVQLSTAAPSAGFGYAEGDAAASNASCSS